jgi:peptidoglycan/LPS O-acetylase OafA/YrhL
MLAAALFFVRKQGKMMLAFISALALICALRCFWAVLELDIWPFSFVFMLASNIILFVIGVGFIAFGVKNTSLLTANIGMVSICALIVMRFFDSDMDILLRGIVFRVLGTAFLLANLRILRVKKQSKEAREI